MSFRQWKYFYELDELEWGRWFCSNHIQSQRSGSADFRSCRREITEEIAAPGPPSHERMLKSCSHALSAG